ncbi:MAG: glycoside hydrolase domain-containing protein [Acidobacteriaceae bacterium]
MKRIRLTSLTSLTTPTPLRLSARPGKAGRHVRTWNKSLAVCVAIIIFGSTGCAHAAGPVQTAPASSRSSSSHPAQPSTAIPGAVAGGYRGFDRNEYPGDQTMAALHRFFAFTGYWLSNPPGETSNAWKGKRQTLLRQGWGFLVLSNGRLDAEILKAQSRGTSPAALARSDAASAIAGARTEGFPAHTILFLDQEEGGELLAEQAAYLLAWTQTVAASEYLPGVYASGQPVFTASGNPVPVGSPATTGQTTTIDDIRSRVVAGGLHPVAIFDAQDACPPAPGCSLQARPLAGSGEIVLNPGGNLLAWQYAQSPRRPELTRSCAATYARDGNCYAPGAPQAFLDMDLAASPDPSHGR